MRVASYLCPNTHFLKLKGAESGSASVFERPSLLIKRNTAVKLVSRSLHAERESARGPKEKPRYEKMNAINIAAGRVC